MALLYNGTSQVIHEDGKDDHHGQGTEWPAKLVGAVDIWILRGSIRGGIWHCGLAGLGPVAELSHGVTA
jgi:hypothetical protein